jgi:hypothetical protein
MEGSIMEKHLKAIRFLNNNGVELFKIPDGASIRIIYPPGDDRGIIERECKYMGVHHFQTQGGDTYHISQFAEIMDRLGARYEPVEWPRGAMIEPFAPGEEKYCTFNREEGNTCIGHLAGEFGQRGDRFFSSWSERDSRRATPKFQADLHGAVYALRQSVLKDHESMREFCQSHPEAKLPGSGDLEHYGFKLEAGKRLYFVRCVAEQYSRDSRFIVYAYNKTAPELEKARPAIGDIRPGTADESKMFYRNDGEGSLSVGYLRGDFGKNGTEFHHSWFDSDMGRNTPEFKAEFQEVMNTLRQGVLKDLRTTQDFCYSHPEAQLPGDIHRYGFKLETETRQYFVRCTVIPNDYFYVFAHDKAAPVLEREKPSVLKQIRDAQKAPKPPRKAKSPEKKKGETEL